MPFFICGIIFSQEKEDIKAKESFIPHEIKLGFNAMSMGRTFFDKSFSSNELQSMLALNKYIMVIDLGTEKRNRGDTYHYSTEGYYFRIGIDKNFIKDKTEGNVLSLGLRYARSSFDQQLNYLINNGFGDQSIQLMDKELKARWIELTANLRGKITSNLYMGCTVRWKFSRNIKYTSNNLIVYDIPGFGNTKKETSSAFEYYIMWRIPFIKKLKNLEDVKSF